MELNPSPAAEKGGGLIRQDGPPADQARGRLVVLLTTASYP